MSTLTWKKFNKTCAFLILVCFLANQPGFADERLLISDLPQAQSALRTPLSHPAGDRKILTSLPFSMNAGTLKNSFEGNSSTYVIHIQDAHINEEIQQNMARLTEYFVKHYGVKTVYLEGASGELSHHLLSRYPDAKARRLVAGMFLKQGLIGGAEYLALTKRPDLVLEGAEDQALYEKNRQAYLESLQGKEKNGKFLSSLRQKMEGLAHHVFPEPMVQWMRLRDSFHKDETRLQDYVPYLVEQCGQASNRCDETTEMRSFLRLQKLSSQFNPEKAKEEWSRLVEQLKSKLSEVKKQELLRYEVLYQKKRLSRRVYASFVASILPPQEPLREFPNLKAYFEMIRTVPRMGNGLFEEIQKAEESLEKDWVKTEDQAVLARFFRILEIYEKLFGFSLSREDAEFFYENREEFYGKVFREKLNAFFARHRFDFSAAPGDFEILDRSVESMEKFYQAAMDRDEVLAKKTLEGMKRRGEKISILVTGGFHTPQIESYLRKRNVSYSVLLPSLKNKFDAEQDQRLYAQSMQAASMPLWNILSEVNPGKGKDPQFQLQPPRRLPLKVQMQALAAFSPESGGFLPQVAAYPFLDFTLQGMLALSLQANRLSPGEFAQYPAKLKGLLDPEEERLAGVFYPFLHDPQMLRREVSAEQGSVLTAFDPSLQFGVSAEWFPLQGNPRENNAVRKQEVYFKTPDGIVTRVRLLADVNQYQSARTGFLRTPSRFQHAVSKLTRIKPAPQNTPKKAAGWHFEAPSFSSGKIQEQPVEDLVPLFAIPSEVDLMMSEELRSEIRCGNQGLLMKREAGESALIPEKAVELMEDMGRVTKTRGEQAAGRVSFTRTGAIYKRVVNPKRADLAHVLRKRSNRAVRKSILTKNSEHTFMVMEHYRYGTSSAPHELETHPHRWLPQRRASVWVYNGSGWQQKKIKLSTYITHNGDFDYWNIFGKDQDNFDVGVWLWRVLQTPNPTLGDSPKIAGMMDLLLTQGMWDASVRLAYQLEIAKSLEDAFGGQKLPRLPEGDYSRDQLLKMLKARMDALPNTAPGKDEIQKWGAAFEKEFVNFKDRLFTSSPNGRQIVPAVMEQFVQELVEALDRENIGGAWTRDIKERFVKTTVKVFMENDLNTATKFFMSRAKGSFGLVTATTLEPEHVIISARGQPMSVGFDRQQQIVAWASESAALKVPVGEHGARIPHRIDLDQIYGEIMDVSIDGIKLYSEKFKREITTAELEHSGRIIDLTDNPYITPLAEEKNYDRVGEDLREIPHVLAGIREDWENEQGFNRQTAEDFLAMAAEQARERWYANDDEQDLIVIGTEISGSIGQHFVEDYKRQNPGARVRFISSNKYLKDAKKKRKPSYLGAKTVVLALSQSGQTFPTLNATILLEKQLPGRVFVMTGELDSLMGTAVEQHYYKGAPFKRRIFTNGSGRRPAEPSTVAAAATHQTLTELLMFVGWNLREKSGLEKPFDTPFNEIHFQKMIKMRNSVIDNGAPSIVGYNTRGDFVESKESRQIRKQARKWAAHVIEPFWIMAWTTAYLIVAIFFGLPLSGLVSSGYSMLTAGLNAGFTYFGLGFSVAALPATVTSALTAAAPYVDTVFGVFFGFIAALGMRAVSKRTLFARMGKRTIVIGDIPYVNYLLEEYVSKLFSMSYGWASVEVHGSDPGDLMVHEHGHRIVRGSLVFLGRPDGAVDAHGPSEADHLMTGKQGKGVRNYNVGAEVVSVGHNPVNNPNAIDAPIELWAHNRPKGEIEEVEEFYESRFSSFERLLSGFVFFHAMAKKVSNTWPISYDMSRTQSGTRVATTRSPVSGADVTQMISQNGNEKTFPRVTEQRTELPFRNLAQAPPAPRTERRQPAPAAARPLTSAPKAAPAAKPAAVPVAKAETLRREVTEVQPTVTEEEPEPDEAELLGMIEPIPVHESEIPQKPVLTEAQQRIFTVLEKGMREALEKKLEALRALLANPPAHFDPDAVLAGVKTWRVNQINNIRLKNPPVADAIEESTGEMELEFETSFQTALAMRDAPSANGAPRNGQASRHEIRKEQLFEALDGTKDLERAVLLANGTHFAAYEQKAAALGLDLTGILENFTHYVAADSLPGFGREEGEIIVDYRPQEHTPVFLEKLFGKLKGGRTRQITFFKETDVALTQWQVFKDTASKLGALQGIKVRFSDDLKIGSLQELVALRAQTLKLPLKDAVQLLNPVTVRESDRKYVQSGQLGAAELSQSTLVVIGSPQAVAGVKTMTFSGILETVFQSRQLVGKSA